MLPSGSRDVLRKAGAVFPHAAGVQLAVTESAARAMAIIEDEDNAAPGSLAGTAAFFVRAARQSIKPVGTLQVASNAASIDEDAVAATAAFTSRRRFTLQVVVLTLVAVAVAALWRAEW